MVLKLYPRIPNRHQLRRLDEISLPTLEEFESRWVVSRQQLANICHTSKSTVDSWYLTGKYHREPCLHHRVWLGIADSIWRKNQ